MRKIKFNSRLSINCALSLIVSTTISALPNTVIAGSRRCYSTSDYTTYCIDNKGYRLDCRKERGDGYDGTKNVCQGKGNYRRECISIARGINSCVDSKGIRTKCVNSGGPVTSCQKSDGTEVKCVYYVGEYTVCNDYDKKGNPI
jgi:hypothetical protein